MFDKDYLKKLYESGHKNFALSLATILYGKEKFHKFIKNNDMFLATLLIEAILLNSCAMIVVLGKKISINIAEKKNEKEYVQEIEEYDKKIEVLAEEIKSLGLTDLETIMLIMNDMKNNYTYGNTDYNICGYWRLHFDEFGQGVCISYADDFAAKINAINPDYNARSLNNYFVDESLLKSLWEDIKTDVFFDKIILGNHAVVAIDIPDKNHTLVVDPTNNTIVGLFANGDIVPFDKDKIYDYKYLGDFAYYDASILEYLNNKINVDYTREEFDSIKVQYNVEQQDSALKNAELKRALKRISS